MVVEMVGHVSSWMVPPGPFSIILITLEQNVKPVGSIPWMSGAWSEKVSEKA